MREMTYRPLGDSGLMVSAVGIGCNAFGRRVDLDGVARHPRRRPGRRGHAARHRRHLRRPGRARRCSARRCRGGATSSWWPPSSAATCGVPTAPTTAPAAPAPTSAARSRRRCGGCGSTTSTSTSTTCPTRSRRSRRRSSVLTDLVREGKVRYLGGSNVGGWQVADADWTARTAGFERFVSVQNRYSLLDRTVEEEVVPAVRAVRARGAALLPAGVRPAHRQVPPRRRTRPTARGPRARPSPWLENADWDRIEAWRSTPSRAASRCSTSRSPVSPPSPPWRR